MPERAWRQALKKGKTKIQLNYWRPRPDSNRGHMD
jgi:hypothetical protein